MPLASGRVPRRSLNLVRGGRLLVLCAALAGVAHSQGAPLPARLTDAEFWHLVTSSSDPGGISPANRDNFTSNEMGFGDVIRRLRAARATARARPPRGGGRR